MIALQCLKYKFLEWCLDTLVNKLSNNFRTIYSQNGIINVKDLIVGMRLSKIESIGYLVKDDFWIWKNIKITDIDNTDGNITISGNYMSVYKNGKMDSDIADMWYWYVPIDENKYNIKSIIKFYL